MPHYGCTKCHHEWDHTFVEDAICAWCGSSSKVLEEQTSLELMLKSLLDTEKEKADE